MNRGLTCPKCKKDLVLNEFKIEKGVVSKEVIRTIRTAICRNKGCKEIYEPCNACEDGILVLKNGINGDFLGCHNYGRTRCSGKKEVEMIV